MKIDGEALNTSCRGIGETLMVPLSVNVQKVLESLMAKGLLKSTGCCAGFLILLVETVIVCGE